MKALVTTLLLSFCLAGCMAAPAQNAPAWRVIPASDLVTGQDVILTVAAGAPEDMRRLAKDIERRYAVEFKAEWPLASIGLHCIVVRVTGNNPSAVIEAMSEDDMIQEALPIQIYETLAAPVYADDLIELQESLRRMRALDVHAATTGANVRVGIIDTGVDFSHPDLKSRRALLRDFVGSGEEDAPPEQHGTVIAGVIAADAQNGTGIVGVAPGADLIGLRGCWEDPGDRIGRCSTFSLARALNFAILADVDVLNISLAGPPDPLLQQLVEQAVSDGVIVVASEGMSPGQNFPAGVEGVIAVAKAGPFGQGRLVAPGVDVISTVPNAGYDFFSGNSVATAHISGMVALLLQAYPGMPVVQVETALRAGRSSDIAQRNGDVVDICKALNSVSGQSSVARC
ncbi:MAG: S8 family serine peptidase [Pseudomonadota bacterium]